MEGVAALRTALVDRFGTDLVICDDDLIAGYEIDWTRRHVGRAAAVLRPRTCDQVAEMVRWCGDRSVALVPQGGNTGLVGGSVPDASGGSVVVSMRGLTEIGPLDEYAGQITVGAGVTLADLENRLAGSHWEFGVDLGARDSATLGGMAATNAGGVRVLRHGTMRANVMGLEAVLGTGEVVSHLGGLVKDNTGYDLAGLLCGSEGTLGIITALRLRLVPRPLERMVVWVACRDWGDAVELATALRRHVEGLDALEAVDRRSVELVADATGTAPVHEPIPQVSLLVAWAGVSAPTEALAVALGDREHAVGVDPSAMRALWERRERVTESVSSRGVPHKLDVTLPLARLAEFTSRVHEVLAPDDVALFGHLGDGNLHVNVVGGGEPTHHRSGLDLDAAVLGLVADSNGSISAEHGIGRHKAPWLHLARSPAELATFVRLKAALDPAGILNPGVLVAS